MVMAFTVILRIRIHTRMQRDIDMSIFLSVCRGRSVSPLLYQYCMFH